MCIKLIMIAEKSRNVLLVDNGRHRAYSKQAKITDNSGECISDTLEANFISFQWHGGKYLFM